MRRLLLSIVLATFSAGAMAADNPFIGHWTSGDLASCSPGYANDVLSIKIGARTIEIFEQGCDIASIRKVSKLPASGYRLKLLCRAPDVNNHIDTLFKLVDKSPLHDRLLIRSDLTTGIVTTYQRCP